MRDSLHLFFVSNVISQQSVRGQDACLGAEFMQPVCANAACSQCSAVSSSISQVFASQERGPAASILASRIEGPREGNLGSLRSIGDGNGTRLRDGGAYMNSLSFLLMSAVPAVEAGSSR